MMRILTDKASFDIVASILGGTILGALITYASMSWLRLWWVFVVLCLFSVMVGAATRDYSVFSAHMIVTTSYGAYCLFPPVALSVRNSGYSEWVLLEYMTICIAGLVGFQLGYYLSPRCRKHESKRVRLQVPLEEERPSMYNTLSPIRLLTVLGMALAMRVFYIMRIGGVSRFFSMGYGGVRYLSYDNLGFLALADDWFSVIICILVEREMLLYRCKQSNVTVWTRIRRYVVWSVLIIWSYVSLRTGGRGQVFRMTLGLLIAQDIMDDDDSRMLRIATVIAAYVFFVMYGHFRNFLANGTLIDVIRAMRSDATLEMVKPTSYGEFINPGLALMELIASQTPRLWGLSYMRIPYIFAPRFLAPNRPPTLGEWRVATFHPSLWGSGGGLGFLTVAEGWLNFGLIGVVVHMCLFGLMARHLDDIRMPETRDNRDLKRIVICSITIPYLAFAGIRIDSAAMLKSFILGYAIPLMFIFRNRGRIIRMT